MSKTPRKQSNNPVGRPRIGDERRVPISASVPESTAARVRSHAAATGQTVSDVVAAILQGAFLADLPPRESLDESAFDSGGGYDPETGSY